MIFDTTQETLQAARDTIQTGPDSHLAAVILDLIAVLTGLHNRVCQLECRVKNLAYTVDE
jgi:hypothetical protein